MKTVVTGGGGFLGSAIVAQLRARGDEVTVVGRGTYPAVEALGARSVPWDLSQDHAGLEEIFSGADVVFHTAARAGVWGSEADFHAINVVGTARVLAACKAAGVRRLVHTSSPSVTFGGHDHEGATEADCPYPPTFEAHYPRTKAIAEQAVLSANGPDLATIALRPHLIWGPGDPHLLPRVVDRARAGRLAIVGDGKNRVGITYVDNAAAAHVAAGDALQPGSANAGKPYFITDLEPVLIWEWIQALLARLDIPPLKRQVSLGAARAAGSALEGAWRLFGLKGEPPMTRFVAAQLATSHWYDLSAARQDFGYAPPVGPEQGLDRTVAWLKTRSVS